MSEHMKYADKKNRKQIGAYDWGASCRPADRGYYFSQATFSAGIFQWGQFKNGAAKKGPALLRIKGHVSEPWKVYEAAEQWCDSLDAGGSLPGKKTVTV